MLLQNFMSTLIVTRVCKRSLTDYVEAFLMSVSESTMAARAAQPSHQHLQQDVLRQRMTKCTPDAFQEALQGLLFSGTAQCMKRNASWLQQGMNFLVSFHRK